MNNVDYELALVDELKFERMLQTLGDSNRRPSSARVRRRLILACFKVG